MPAHCKVSLSIYKSNQSKGVTMQDIFSNSA